MLCTEVWQRKFPLSLFNLFQNTHKHSHTLSFGRRYRAGISGKWSSYSSLGWGSRIEGEGFLKGEAPQDVWHVSPGPQATSWRKAQPCGGLFVCVKLAWPPVPLHLFPISRAESIKQGADRGWEQSSSCLDHGVYYLAVRALPAGEPAVTRPRLLRSDSGRAVCRRTDRRRTGETLTANGGDS